MKKQVTAVLERVAIGGLMLCLMTSDPSNVWAVPTTWTSASNTDWNNNANWTGGLPATGPISGDDVTFSGAGAVGSVSVNGAARAASTLTFNSNQSSFQIIDLANSNPLSINGQGNSTTAVDISVTSGNPKIVGSKAISGVTGDLMVTNLAATDYFVVDIFSGSSLDIQASTGGSSSGTTRQGRFVKQGLGTLTFSAPTNIDVRPTGDASLGQGGIDVNAGVLQFAAEGARGNPFSPINVASSAMLEFAGAGFYGSPANILGDGGNRAILTLSGTGVGGLGALYNSAGDNVLASGGNSSGGLATGSTGLSSGIIVLASDTSIGVTGGAKLTLSHGITNFSAYNPSAASPTPKGSGTAGSLTKVGAGTLVFDANNNSARNGYEGDIVVNQGTFLVNSPTESTELTGDVTGVTTVVLADPLQYANLFVGQPVTGTGIAPGTVIAGIGTAGLRLSEEATVAPGISLNFGAVTSALNTSPVTVNIGATLGGTGSILGSAVTIDEGGFLSPGNSIGVFTVGSATIDGSLLVEIDETNALTNDLLVVAGNLDLTGADAVFDITGALTLPSYLLATYGGLLEGSFDSADAPVGYLFDYSTPGEVSLSIVPEPSAVLLASMGLVGTGIFRRRRKR